MARPDGARRLIDAVLVFLGWAVFVVGTDLLFHLVAHGLKRSSAGALSVPAVLAVGAVVMVATAIFLALMRKWSQWTRARLSTFHLYVLSAAGIPFVLFGQDGWLSGVVGVPAAVAFYGAALLLVGVWVLAPVGEDRPKVGFLLAGFLALDFGRYALTAPGLRAHWPIALGAAVSALMIAWLALSRLPLERLGSRARPWHAVALAALIAVCWAVSPHSRVGERPLGAGPGPGAPRHFPDLGLVTAGDVTRAVHGELTPEKPVLGMALEVKGDGPLCEVSLFGETPEDTPAILSCTIHVQAQDGEQKLLTEGDLSLPMTEWRSFVLELDEYAGKPCLLTLSLAAVEDVPYSVVVNASTYQKRSPDAYNVLLISLDGVRADHLSCYGYGRTTSPSIDRAAAEGVRFERCNAQAPWSFPSLFSMLVGEFPSVMWADQPMGEPARWFCGNVPTLAQVLSTGGYQTGAITDGGPTVPQGGLYQGFNSFRVCESPRIESTYHHAARWLRENANAKLFLFVHSYEATAPYREPLFPPSGPTLPEQTIAGYDTDIVHADAMVGLLLRELERLGISDRTLVVITSAHGQDFTRLRLGPAGPEGTFGHALTQSVLHVPLVMRAPGLLPAGKVVPQRVAAMDVAPTVQSLLGFEPRHGPLGFDLTPVVEGKGYELGRRVVFSEATCWGPERKALVRGRYKLVVTPVPWEQMSEAERRVRSAAGASTTWKATRTNSTTSRRASPPLCRSTWPRCATA